MATPRRSRITTTLGIALIALAVVLELWVVPAVTKLPGSFDRTAKFAGTIQSVDAATFQLGQAAPVTAERRVQVTETEGDAAVIDSNLTLHTPAGDSEDVHVYAVSRKDYKQLEAAGGTAVEDQQDGMTMSRPANPGKDGFKVYDPVTHTAYAVEYTGTRTVEGREVYDFAGETTAPVKSESHLAQLQGGVAALAKTGDGTTVPKALLQGLAQTMTPEQADAMGPLLAQLPDQVPLVFTAKNELKVAIDAKLGAPIETAQTRTFTVNIETGAEPVPLVALSKLDLEQTPASVKDTADFVSSNATKLAVARLWVPLALVIAGLVLIGLGLRRRGQSGTTKPARSEELVTQDS